MIYAQYEKLKKQSLVITNDEANARALVEDINAMAGEDIAFLYPSRDFTLRQVEVASREYEQIRLGVLSRIISGECRIVVAGIDAVMQHTIPKNELTERIFSIDINREYSVEELSRMLIRSGYEKKTQVEGTAQFSVRGGIVDIFPPGLNSPVRIELWGDSIDAMSYFDIATQRRNESVDLVDITPANEVLFNSNEELKEKLIMLLKSCRYEKAKTCIKKDIDKLEGGIPLNSVDKYLKLAYEKGATLFDYLDEPNVFINEYSSVKERAKTYAWQQQEDIKELLEDGEVIKQLIDYDASFDFVMNRAEKCPSCFLDTFARTNSDVKFKELISINPIQTSSFSGDLKLLSEDVTQLLSEDYAVIVMAGTPKSASALASDLENLSFKAEYVKDTDNLKPGKITVIAGSISGGFEYPEIKVNLITTGRTTQIRKKRERFKKGKQLRSLTDLVRGDLVVHVSYGIGVFDGIHKIELQGVVKDYIKIRYQGTDTLYVPVTQLDLVSKYIGAKDDGKVKLNKLSSGEWHKTRQRVKPGCFGNGRRAYFALR